MSGERAAAVYRAFGDFCLYWCGGEASFLALDDDLREHDQNAWTTAYLTADQAEYPATWQVREHLAEVERRHDLIAETALSVMLSGLQAQAPKPCDCLRHAGA